MNGDDVPILGEGDTVHQQPEAHPGDPADLVLHQYIAGDTEGSTPGERAEAAVRASQLEADGVVPVNTDAPTAAQIEAVAMPFYLQIQAVEAEHETEVREIRETFTGQLRADKTAGATVRLANKVTQIAQSGMAELTDVESHFRPDARLAPEQIAELDFYTSALDHWPFAYWCARVDARIAAGGPVATDLAAIVRRYAANPAKFMVPFRGHLEAIAARHAGPDPFELARDVRDSTRFWRERLANAGVNVVRGLEGRRR
jgi:hypothetical protein